MARSDDTKGGDVQAEGDRGTLDCIAEEEPREISVQSRNPGEPQHNINTVL